MPPVPTPKNWAIPAGYYAALISTAGGVIYFLVLLVAMLTGGFVFPPAGWLQLFGGVSTLLLAPFLVVLAAALHSITPPHKQILSQLTLGFTLLFVLAVSINRFSQLGVVRQAEAAGSLDAIHWFQAYGDFSIMLGLEYLGWTWFLGLGLLCAVPLFGGRGLEGWIRALLLIYVALALIAAVGFLLGSWLSLLGFAAWGVVLYILTALLAVYFRRLDRAPGAPERAA